ncbi:hypothetical protein [Streptosporangium sp. NPDC004631]
MTDLTPAEELRAAVTELRRIAESGVAWPWVRHISPTLAAPLAAWLEEAARQAACHQQTPGYVGLPDYRLCHDCQEEECYGLQALDKALAVARVILGGDEKPAATTKDGAR